jgi:hypothetical protein
MTHHYWTTVLRKAESGLFILADVERLVTEGWEKIARKGFVLLAPAVTDAVLLRACASASTGWRKIGEVLMAACDAVPARVPNEFRERFRELADQ